MIKKIKDWKIYYAQIYKKSYENFIADFLKAQKSCKNLSLEEKAAFWQKYYSFIRKTLKIFTYFFCASGLFVKNEKITLLYILNLELTGFGEDFFKLVNELNILKRSKFLNTKKLHEKFLSATYLSIFEQLNNFLEKKVENGADNGI